jgi:hypothetical protein
MSGINRIFNIPLNFGIGRQTKSSDREPQQQSGGYSRQQKERQPTEEEAQKAFGLLLEMESIKRNGLTVVLETDATGVIPVYVLIVKDKAGAQLRGLRGADILRLIEQGAEKPGAAENGRILDRRV